MIWTHSRSAGSEAMIHNPEDAPACLSRSLTLTHHCAFPAGSSPTFVHGFLSTTPAAAATMPGDLSDRTPALLWPSSNIRLLCYACCVCRGGACPAIALRQDTDERLGHRALPFHFISGSRLTPSSSPSSGTRATGSEPRGSSRCLDGKLDNKALMFRFIERSKGGCAEMGANAAVATAIKMVHFCYVGEQEGGTYGFGKCFGESSPLIDRDVQKFESCGGDRHAVAALLQKRRPGVWNCLVRLNEAGGKSGLQHRLGWFQVIRPSLSKFSGFPSYFLPPLALSHGGKQEGGTYDFGTCFGAYNGL